MHRVDTAGAVTGMWVDKNPPGTPGTLMGQNWHNAVQEEVARLVEAFGLTLSASGSADASAGWIQLREAIMRKFIGADPRYYGAVGDGVTDDRAAFVAALAASNVLLIPEGTFLISSTITLPESAVIIGKGLNSIIKVTANDNIFSVTNTSAVVSDVTINGNSTGTAQHFLSVNMTSVSDKQVFLRNIFANGLGGIGVDVNATQAGNNLLVSGCQLQYCSIGIRFGADSGDLGMKAIVSNSQIRNCDYPIWDAYSSARKIIEGSEIFDGTLYLDQCSGSIFSECQIDIDSYDFNTALGISFEQCHFPQTLSNSIPTDAAAKASYFAFRSCWVHNGSVWLPGYNNGVDYYENMIGGHVQYTLTAPKSVAASTFSEGIGTSQGYGISSSQRIGSNASQTAFTLFDAGSGKIFKRTGGGLVHVTAWVELDPGSADIDKILCYIRTYSSAGSALLQLPMPRTSNGIAGATTQQFAFGGVLALNKDESFRIEVTNADSTNSVSVESSTTRTRVNAFGL